MSTQFLELMSSLEDGEILTISKMNDNFCNIEIKAKAFAFGFIIPNFNSLPKEYHKHFYMELDKKCCDLLQVVKENRCL